MGAYSFYCAKCGYSFTSDDKAVVAMIRQGHRRKKSWIKRDSDGNLRLNGNHSCGLRRLEDGTAARPGLVIQNPEVVR